MGPQNLGKDPGIIDLSGDVVSRSQWEFVMRIHPRPTIRRLELFPGAAIAAGPQERSWSDCPDLRVPSQDFNIPGPWSMPRRMCSFDSRAFPSTNRRSHLRSMVNRVQLPLTAAGAVGSLGAGIRSMEILPAAPLSVLRDWVESQ